jgi:hypothetical protein
MSNLEQAARQALDALEHSSIYHFDRKRNNEAMETLRAALAQQAAPVVKALGPADLLAEYLGKDHPAVRAISAEMRRQHAEIIRLEARERGRQIALSLNVQEPPDAKPKQAEPVVAPVTGRIDKIENANTPQQTDLHASAVAQQLRKLIVKFDGEWDVTDIEALSMAAHVLEQPVPVADKLTTSQPKVYKEQAEPVVLTLRNLLITAAATAVAAERKGEYRSAAWVADSVLEEHPQQAEPVKGENK